MGNSVWIEKWNHVEGVTGEEADFLEEHFPDMDEVRLRFAVDEDTITETERDMTDEERREFGPLLRTLKEAVKKEGGPATMVIG